jgi:tetratricopeptide (TPR) repeat protein
MTMRMNNVPLSLELVPMDEAPGDEAPKAPPTPEPSTTTARAQEAAAAAEASLDAIEILPVGRTYPAAGAAPAVDPFVAQASREYAGGHLDKPLWDRALGQSNGDAAAASEAYVRARAVALRMADRNRRVAIKRAAAARESDDERAKPAPRWWQRYRLAIVAAALIVPAGIAGAVYMTFRGDDAVAGTSPAAGRAAAAPVAAPAPAHRPAEAAAVKEAQANAALAAKVQELRDTGNFNVMVLYATEWTRKQPTNATAWDELRGGYVQLRQYEDARAAARKAAQLAPDDARLWRSLAAVNMDIDDPEGALAAYEQAAALNSVDVESLHAIALLQARLGRPQESKAAFDRATAASPADPVTACLRTGVAQMPAARDGYTLSRQIRAIDNRCHGKSDAVASAR